MAVTSKDIYRHLTAYIYELVGDNNSSLRLVNLLTRADVPLQTFITSTKLYKMILNRVNRLDSRYLSNRQFHITKEMSDILKNQYLIFLTCCMITSKYYRDISFTNESWENVSETSKSLLNESEKICLTILDYQISGQGDKLVYDRISEILRRAGVDYRNEKYEKVSKVRTFLKAMLCFG